MTPDKNKEPNLEYSDLASFFPSLSTTDSGLTERNNHQSKKNESKRSVKSIKKTILIQRRSFNSDILICNSCILTGDRWFMEKHPCKQNIRNNFSKVTQCFQN